MKKAIAVLATMISFNLMHSQATLDFCASVDQYGNCAFNNTKFISSPDSVTQRLFMELRSKGTPIGSANVIFKIYSISGKGEEKFESMVSQKIDPTWYMSWSPYVFKSPGKYDVKIYDDADKLLCNNTFELISFK